MRPSFAKNSYLKLIKVLCALLLAATCFNASATIYVTTTGAGTHSGTSWANAKTFQEATSPLVYDELWVQAGTYDGGGAAISIEWSVYGGFNGTETTKEQRDIKTNVTVFQNFNNGINLFPGAAGAVLDGFTCVNAPLIHLNGSTVRNCIFDNSFVQTPGTYGLGGNTFTDCVFKNCVGLHNSVEILSGPATFTRCIFKDNQRGGTSGGGAVDIEDQTSTGTNNVNGFFYECIFDHNSSNGRGGAISFYHVSNLRVVNCLFKNNTSAQSFGAAVSGFQGSANLYFFLNTFSGNTGRSVVDIQTDAATGFFFANNIVWGNTTPQGTSWLHTDNSTGDLLPFFVYNNLIQDDMSANGGDVLTSNNTIADPLFNVDFTLSACSPAINAGRASIFFTNQVDATGGRTTDLAGDPRVYGSNPDLGCYEFQGSSQIQDWVMDADNDGHYTGSPVNQCASPGTGYVIKTTQQAGDCDDNDNTKWQSALLYVDADGDGYTVGSATSVCYGATIPTGYSAASSGSDCDDNNEAIHPGAAEICGNAIDENCDGVIEGCPVTFYADSDNDGYGKNENPLVITDGSAPTSGYSLLNGDCNDNNGAIHPGATEICGNGIDENCNGSADDVCPCYAYLDNDGDGYGESSSAIQVTCGTGIPGRIGRGGDCDDTNPAIHPGATEICGNGIDENCNGSADDVCPCYAYLDNDGDGYGESSSAIQVTCGMGIPGRIGRGGDCDDTNPAIHPGATEICGNGIDENCNGAADDVCPCYAYLDNDGDGYGESSSAIQVTCGLGIPGRIGRGGDCDDTNPAIHPGATEICGNGIDENCNGAADDVCPCYAYLDNDGDGYGESSSAIQVTCGLGIPGRIGRGGDCDDTNPAIHPGATEICGNGIDENCNGSADDVCPCYAYLDNDGDGYGENSSAIQVTCGLGIPGRIGRGGDCDDTNPAIHPGATEICGNGIDENCNGAADDVCPCYAYLDNDGDGYGENSSAIQVTCGLGIPGRIGRGGDCDDTNPAIHPGATEICGNGIDENCNGAADDVCPCYAYLDNDGDGYGESSSAIQVTCGTGIPGRIGRGGDCDDTKSSVRPGAPEICDGLDNNCNGQIDEGVPAVTYYRDKDGDGYGNAAMTTTASCSASVPRGYVSNNTDCDDSKANVRPGATEICDGIDNNCNGQIDEGVKTTYYRDADGDGYGNILLTTQACAKPSGYVANNTDCNDASGSVRPGAVEVCGNGIDDNCNGNVDENCGSACSNATNLTTTNITSGSATLNWVAAVNPAAWEVQYKLATSTKWKTVSPAPALSARSVIISGLTAGQTYNWRIAAKCGKTLTPYVNASNFTTLTVLARSINAESQPLNAVEEKPSALKLYPNPSNGQFMVDLHLAEKINATAKLQLIDITGRTVYVGSAIINNGVLQEKVSISSLLSAGIYTVEVIANGKSYFSKLMYGK